MGSLGRFPPKAMDLRFQHLCRVIIVATFALAMTGCGLINAVLGTALGLTGPALQYKVIYRCVPEGTAVDTPDGPRLIEELHPGDTVIGYGGSPVRVMQKHAYLEENSSGRFLTVEFESGAVVHSCDMHRIGGERAMNLEPGDRVGGTFRKETVAAVRPFESDVVRSYDLLTEDEGYQISGIPVNSMIEELNEAIRQEMQARLDAEVDRRSRRQLQPRRQGM